MDIKVLKPIVYPLTTIDYILYKYLGKYPKLYFAWEGLKQIRKLRGLLTNKDVKWLKTNQDSKTNYNSDGLRPIMLYEHGSRVCYSKGHIVMRSFREIREQYLRYIYEYIDTERPKRILEVGCGNVQNLLRIKEYCTKDVELCGVDISGERIRASRIYYGERLKGIQLHTMDFKEGMEYCNGYFDMVFSYHCLEQITYNCESALKEIQRLSSSLIVLLEPIFELGNFNQRLHMINCDHNRILLKTINELGMKINRVELLDCMANPVNPSGIVEITK